MIHWSAAAVSGLAATAAVLATPPAPSLIEGAQDRPHTAMPSHGPIRFSTNAIKLTNARAGRPYRAKISGMVLGATPGTFRLRSAPPWARLSSDGVLRGVPDRPGRVRILVEAGNDAGGVARARLRLNVRAPGALLAPRLTVMSFNMWYGGTQVDAHREKQIRFLAGSGADIVGLQEQYNRDGRHTSRDLAKALGWHHYSGGYDLAILSRYPIVKRGYRPRTQHQTERTPVIQADIVIDEVTGQRVSVWNLHTAFDPYTPYDMCFGRMSPHQLQQREKQSGRPAQVRAIMAKMRGALSRSASVPVLLTGDFNSPSHLDYTPATASRHCGYSSFAFPSSVLPQRAGLIDSFRRLHPDPLAAPGNSWSTVDKRHSGWPPYERFKGNPEPQDRVDYVYYAGRMRPLRAQMLIVGRPRPQPHVRHNAWTSDHAAMMTTFHIQRPTRAGFSPSPRQPGSCAAPSTLRCGIPAAAPQ